MDDTKPANESNEQGLNKIDLSQLQNFSFGTQWTEVKHQPGPSRDREDRRERREGGDRGRPSVDRRGFRRPAGAPGADSPGGPGRERGPGPQGGERDQGFRGGPRRDFGSRRDPRDFRGGEGREGGHFERGGQERAPFERGPYISPHFVMTCYPEDAGFTALVKAVRASCRTFQLFEIAKAVLEKNERFVVVIQRKPAGADRAQGAAPKQGEAEGSAPATPAEKPSPLYMSVPDHLPFETEEAAIHHVLTSHLGQFFEQADVEIDAPKGNFPIINKCGITGELLGPPNYHRYQQILQQHHASRLGRMSFDRFRERIESVRDPEVVAQWLAKMKKATRYTWKVAAKAAPAAAATEAPAPEGSEVAAVAPAPAEAPAAPVDAAPAVEQAPASGPSFDSLEEARAYLLTNAKEKVVRALENIRFHGRLMENLPPGEIRRAIEGHLERQRRFPLDTANALRGRLRREGFTIFKKGSRGVSYVCAVKRRFRIPGQVFSESITTLIDFVEKRPLVHVKDLAKDFLGIDIAAAVAAVPAEGTPASQSPFAALPADQAERLRKMTNDLRWLVSEGYVTEFSDGKLFAPPPVAPQAGKKADEHGEEHDPVDFPEAPAPAAESAPAAASETAPVESSAPESEVEAAGPVESPAEPGAPAPEPVAEPEKPAGDAPAS